MDDERRAGGSGTTGEALRSRRRRPRSEAELAARLATGDAWSDFLRSLADAGSRIARVPLADPPLQRPEGTRYLLGLLLSGITQALELGDPEQPRFVRDPDSGHKWGAENADNQYLWARIEPSGLYRIRGRRRGVFELLVELKQGYMQLGDDGVYASATLGDLQLDADGRFELLLSAERPAGDADWLPIHPDARYVTVRQYLVDWEHEQPAELGIERVGFEGVPATAPGPAETGALLDRAGEWIQQSARFWCEWVEELRAGHEPGRLRPARRFVGGADDIYYGNDWWQLGPEEALVVETLPPDARYWQFQLGDVWFRTLDYATRQTSLNHHQARLDADGRFRCVIAHRDPGVPNWLDTAGQPEGLLQYRWIWTRDNPEPSVRRVPFVELRQALPAETPTVTPDERSAALAARRAHVRRREPVT